MLQLEKMGDWQTIVAMGMLQPQTIHITLQVSKCYGFPVFV